MLFLLFIKSNLYFKSRCFFKTNRVILKGKGVNLMKKTKSEVIDNYDLLYNICFFKELEESEEDMKNGRVITLEELDNEMEAKYESYRYLKS
jgi:hypothetical protein